MTGLLPKYRPNRVSGECFVLFSHDPQTKALGDHRTVAWRLKPSSSLRSLSFSTLKLMRSTCSNLRPHSDTNNWSDRIPSSHSPWIADESKNEQKLLPFIYQWEFWVLNFCRFPFIVFISVVFFFLVHCYFSVSLLMTFNLVSGFPWARRRKFLFREQS